MNVTWHLWASGGLCRGRRVSEVWPSVCLGSLPFQLMPQTEPACLDSMPISKNSSCLRPKCLYKSKLALSPNRGSKYQYNEESRFLRTPTLQNPQNVTYLPRFKPAVLFSGVTRGNRQEDLHQHQMNRPLTGYIKQEVHNDPQRTEV